MFLIIFLLLNPTEDDLKEKYSKATELRNPLEAVEYYRQIVREDSESPYADSALFRIAMFYYTLGDYRQSIDALQLIHKKKDRSDFYLKSVFWLKYCYRNIGDSAEVEKYASLYDSLKKVKTESVKMEFKTVENGEIFYTVQLGAYSENKWADFFIKRLDEHELKSFTMQDGSMIKIFSGQFSSKAEAQGHLKLIQEKGFDGFVVKIEN